MVEEERAPEEYVFNLRIVFEPKRGMSINPGSFGVALQRVAEREFAEKLRNWGFFSVRLGEFGVSESGTRGSEVRGELRDGPWILDEYED